MTFSLGLLSGCGDDESKREAIANVKKVMAMRKQAIETKDIELYKSLFLTDYDDGKSKYRQQMEYMQSVFDRFEKVEFTYQKSMVDLTMNTARMVGKISYKPSGAKIAHDQEIAIFRRIDGKWYFSGGVKIGLF